MKIISVGADTANHVTQSGVLENQTHLWVALLSSIPLGRSGRCGRYFGSSAAIHADPTPYVAPPGRERATAPTHAPYPGPACCPPLLPPRRKGSAAGKCRGSVPPPNHPRTLNPDARFL